MEQFDIGIIGLGSTGMAAARELANAGKRVVVFEQGPRGTLCIRKGCMPSKGLFVPTHHHKHMQHYKDAITNYQEPQFNIDEIFEQSRRWRQEFLDYRIDAENNQKFTRIDAKATIINETTIEADDKQYEVQKMILCTGSKMFIPNIDGLEQTPYWTSDDIFELTQEQIKGKRIVIVGGGVIATEMAQFFSSLGFNVIMLIRANRVLQMYDETISKSYMDARSDIQFWTNGEMQSVAYNDEFTITLKDNQIIQCDHLLVCTGRTPNVPQGIENLNVEMDKRIKRNEFCQTSNANIYAGGDLAGIPILHEARQEGEYIAKHILGQTNEPYKSYKVGIVFSYPHIASVGKHEHELEPGSYLKAEMIFDDGRSIIEHNTQGMIQLLTDKQGVVLGCSIVNNTADLLIHCILPYVQHRLNILDYTDAYHPTQAEVFLDLQDLIKEQITNNR